MQNKLINNKLPSFFNKSLEKKLKKFFLTADPSSKLKDAKVKQAQVLILSSTWGHDSLAKAISQGLNKANISNYIYTKKDFLNDLYRFIYQKFPELNKVAERGLEQKMISQLVVNLTVVKLKPLVQHLIKLVKPQVVISTYAEFNPTLEKLKAKTGLIFFNQVANPRSLLFEPCEIAEVADANFVFDEKQKQSVEKQAKFEVVGWPTRNGFFNPNQSQLTKLKKKLKIKQNRTVILFTTGSEGIDGFKKLKKIVATTQAPVQIVAAAGSNSKLLNKFKKLNNNSNHSNCQIIPLNYTKQLHLYMHLADLIIGKAGPNTIFEAAATQTPFVACDYIPGQEDDNFKLIKEYDLGWIEPNPDQLAKLTNDLISNKTRLLSKNKSIKKLAHYNSQAVNKIVNTIKSKLK